MHGLLLASQQPSALELFLQHCLIGLTNGSLFALIALGYTMVYGIIGLINFAHGDLFMLGCFLAFSILGALGLETATGMGATAGGILVLALCVPLFCGALNLGVDRFVYKPLRNAPKLAPLVSAIGVSFIFVNIGLLWGGASDRHFPDLLPNYNLFGTAGIRFTIKDLMVVVTTVPLMIALTVFVRYSKLGKAMRATQQDPLAARLMGINVDRVIGATFAIGGALAGAASIVYGLYINTVSFQMGFQNGLYAFTAAVLGGIGSLPGAMLGGLLIGLIEAFWSGYFSVEYKDVAAFSILVLVLIFRPTGLLGKPDIEKV
jgi:branched-chain amino acid transport system permease protein